MATENSSNAANLPSTQNRLSNSNNVEEKRDVSPQRKIVCQDDTWNKYETIASDERGATALRSDNSFLTKLLSLLSSNINEVLRTKDKKVVIQAGLKVLNLIIIKGKVVDKKLDIVKDSNIPNYLLNLLKNILKIDGGRNHV